jgi:hypothetical protein
VRAGARPPADLYERLGPSIASPSPYSTGTRGATCSRGRRCHTRACSPARARAPAAPLSPSTTGVPDGQGQRSIQIDGLRVPCVNRSKLQATSTDLFFGAGEAQGRTRHDRVSILSTQKSALPGTAALSQTQTGPESRSKSLARAWQALASDEEESLEARRFGYGHIDTGSRWTSQVSQCKCARGMRELARGD